MSHDRAAATLTEAPDDCDAKQRAALCPGQLVPLVGTADAPVWEGRVGLVRRRRVLLDTRAVLQRYLVAWIEDRLVVGARADHEHHALPVAGADERMRRVRRAVHEVPRPQTAFLALDDQQT